MYILHVIQTLIQNHSNAQVKPVFHKVMDECKGETHVNTYAHTKTGCNFSSQKVELILKVPCKLTFQRAEYCVTMITNNYVGKMQ